MNTKALLFIILVVLMQGKSAVFAQATYRFGIMPSLNLNSALKNNWSLNAKAESRQLLKSGTVNGDAVNEYRYVLTDLSLIAAKKVGLNSRIAGGYLMRIEDGEISHRFIQHFIIVQKFAAFRLAHRFMSDQTFSESEKPEIRVRYRISSELPLNGESVDPGEFYVKVSNEYINSFQAKDYDLEIRLVPLLGYDITDNFKIETGPDYRLNSFLSSSPRHSYWMTLNIFIEI
ncbi:DUF2490 domain-containing protein [Lentimicrobium sp.]|uniref:DUF2490 domain-containing protein n=1 Tax=Lentimicrobium sp. TaxID=2034841 RepID=UPI002CFF2F4D|nr:DUF2490 domain-containing protein [Lentimicrobium sp.]HPJ62865.1 DUF2490 domain-containing protein [Lentimicrobium sp.]